MIKRKSTKILIVGLGQIGGSLGIDLVGKKIVDEVIGFDIDHTVGRKALRKKAVDRMVYDLDKTVSSIDLVILAAPIRQIIKLIPEISSKLKKDAAIFDVAGTKIEILKVVKSLGQKINYIGGHPMTGTEKIGIEGAEKDKFKNTVFILTPAQGTSNDWVESIKNIVTRLGAKPVMMKADQHDRLISLTSQLPYILSLSLMNLTMEKGKIDRKLWDLIGGSFRSATRVAGSDVDLTLDMFLSNQKNAATSINEIILHLNHIKKLIKTNDSAALKKMIKKAKKKREVKK